MAVLCLIIRALVVIEIIAAAAFLFYCGQMWQPVVLMILGIITADILDFADSEYDDGEANN